MSQCPCQSGKEYEACCGPIISGSQAADTAEALMRSRYTAFVNSEIDYLKNSLHPDHRADFDPVSIKEWADSSEWLGLRIINTTGGGKDDQTGTVEFMVLFRIKDVTYQHHEVGEFNRVNGIWYYTDGKVIQPDNPQP
jgi:SEC-C motif-containing protein